ncbi:hypothetical protein E6C27_scaffold437G00590 [Cucumis melo var. makuwa]|uniref:Uncharacterized protein n=1 Tax=Cucumis melo var. makuwa TaxID=1194695 RepID=A0A5A7UKF8_CUCMM|nr:hypothetical protein E6C27_scaffold437G00590 [Cucumis melo var. makuwa]
MENVAVRKKVAKHREVNHLEVVAEEFNQEIERMSPLEPRLIPKELGLGMLPFNCSLPDFLFGSIKPLKWEIFFIDETNVRLDIVNMFYAAKYPLEESYVIVEGRRFLLPWRKLMNYMASQMTQIHTLARVSSLNLKKETRRDNQANCVAMDGLGKNAN